MTLVDVPAFGAWSLLSLTTTAHGAPVYPDELGVRYVYDTAVPNGRYIVPGDLAVVRDNRIVFGAGWIDSIEATPGRKIRYRCPKCTSTDFKQRSKRQFAYRCAACTTEFDVPVEEELTVQVFTANYSRTWSPADWPFPVQALDSVYIAKAQQHAIRRLDVTQLRPVLEAHLVTGEPWWDIQVREEERIPGGHSVGLSKTRVGQQRFREAMLGRYGEACAFTGPQPPGALEAAHLYLYSENPEHDLKGGLLLRCDLHALFDRWLITIDSDTWSIQVAPELGIYPDLAKLDGPAGGEYGDSPASPEGHAAVLAALVAAVYLAQAGQVLAAVVVVVALVSIVYVKGTSPGGARERKEFQARRDQRPGTPVH